MNVKMVGSACAAIVIAMLINKKKKHKNKRHRICCRNWYMNRPTYSCKNLLEELRISSRCDFQNFHRMDVEVFDELLEKN